MLKLWSADLLGQSTLKGAIQGALLAFVRCSDANRKLFLKKLREQKVPRTDPFFKEILRKA